MKEIYQRLWDFFSDAIIQAPIDMRRLEKIAQHNHMVFSTIPLNVLIDPSEEAQNYFPVERVYCYPRMMVPGYGASAHTPNTIVYNGWQSVGWYRQSCIFGQEWTEWPSKVGVEGVEADVLNYGHEWNSMLLWQAVKPLVCTLPIHLSIPPNVKLVGRYGQWRKGVLAHEAYVDTVNYLEGTRIQRKSASTTPPATFG